MYVCMHVHTQTYTHTHPLKLIPIVYKKGDILSKSQTYQDFNIQIRPKSEDQTCNVKT